MPDEVVRPEPIPMPTGLSDEDDARAYLAQRFNGMFCPCCELYWNKEDVTHGLCPNCTEEENEPVELQEFGHERPWHVKDRRLYSHWAARRPLPSQDPKIAGELWINNGKLDVSRG